MTTKSEGLGINLQDLTVYDVLGDASPVGSEDLAPAGETQALGEQPQLEDLDDAEETQDTPDLSVDGGDMGDVNSGDEDLLGDDSSDDAAEDLSIIQELSTRMGYKVDGDFSDDYEGVVSYTKGVAEQMASQQLQNFFEAYPQVKDFYDYSAAGGEAKKYFKVTAPEVDYATLEIKEDNVSQQKRILSDFYGKQGWSQDEITEQLDDFEDAGFLHKQATKAAKRLETFQSKEKELVVEQQKAQAQEQAENQRNVWNNIQSTVQAGHLSGIEVPENEKQGFFKWMSAGTDNQGNTQRDIDRSHMDMESSLALEYLIYKKLDFSKLLQSRSTTAKTRTLSQKLKQTPASKRMKSTRSGSAQARVDSLSLDDLL